MFAMTNSICKYDSAKQRQYMKRKTAKANRRNAKLFLEDAPKKNCYRGYWT